MATKLPSSSVEAITEELRGKILEALHKRQKKKLIQLVGLLHPADVADLIEQLSPPQRHDFLAYIKPSLDAEVLAEVNPRILESMLEQYSSHELATAIQELDSDDAVAVIEDLDHEQRLEVLDELSQKDRLHLLESLSYGEDTAGRLIQREILALSPDKTLEELLRVLRYSRHLPDILHEVYIVDAKQHLLGYIPLLSIIRHKNQDTPLSEMMEDCLHKLSPHMKQADIVYLFKQYALSHAPVVDDKGRLLGVITADDVLHVLDEQADEDFLHLGGVMEHSESGPLLQSSLSRLRWLFVTFVNTLIASSVLYQFEHVIEKYVALAILMPIVAAMGGNAGMQAVTLTVRGLATKHISSRESFFSKRLTFLFGREGVMGLLNGGFFALLMATIAGLWYKDPLLGFVLGSAMIFNMVWACLAGTFIPILIHRLGFDPAISAGPFLTTTTDVLGFTVFLGLSTLFLV